ncbi:MAG: hypothetical protein A2Y88_04595 [Chloroflexi bacterium RBG_13_48_10]|nr:MAG: hypothetical protein A2Y88_04595 [Chloroflexi bacterium RBG_13_48_10]
MSVNQNSIRTINWKSALVVTLLVAFAALLATPLGPLGVFWRPSADIPVANATTIQLLLFLVLNITESLAFGLGIAFLIFGYPLVRAISPASFGLTRATHIAITWLLSNWWIHDGLHTHIGMSLDGLLGIEYGFHVTLMIAGVILAIFFLTLIRQEKAVSPAMIAKHSIKEAK